MDEKEARHIAAEMIQAARERLHEHEPRKYAFALAGMAGMTALMHAEMVHLNVGAEWYEAVRLVDERYQRSLNW